MLVATAAILAVVAQSGVGLPFAQTPDYSFPNPTPPSRFEAQTESPPHLAAILSRYGRFSIHVGAGGTVSGALEDGRPISLYTDTGGLTSGFIGDDAVWLQRDSTGGLSGHVGGQYVALSASGATSFGAFGNERIELRRAAGDAARSGDESGDNYEGLINGRPAN